MAIMKTFKKPPASLNIFQEDLDESSSTLLSSQSCLAIDTEAMGLIHGRDRLCLIQICDEKDNVICIKIKKDQKASPRLKSIMENDSIEKIFHFARFDVAALKSNLNIEVNSIFCTKIASKLGRSYSPRHGLKEVILDLIGIELDKQSQCSDWGNESNLSEKQLEYAANDVRYLIQAKNKLKEILIREGRWDIAKRSFECIPVLSELDRLRFNNIFEH